MHPKTTNKQIFSIVISLIIFLAACTPVTPAGQVIEEPTPVPPTMIPIPDTPTPTPETVTIFIRPETVECVGVAPQRCLVIRNSEDGEWEYFYDSIDGFEFEEGFDYEIIVNRIDVENPPADGSSFRYELVEIVSKAEAEGNPLAGTNWDLVGYGDPENLTPPVTGAEVTINFQDGNAGGRAACNWYGSDYTLEGNSFKWAEPYFAVTQMACEQPLMAQESAFLEILVKTESYTLDGDRLTLQTPDGIIIFEKPEQAELENTDWTLIGIGGTRTYLDDNITARFEAGTISGSGGCNGYSAGYEIDGSALTFGPAMSTLMACEQEIMARELEFQSALANVAGFKIERNILRLLDADGMTIMSFATGEIPEA